MRLFNRFTNAIERNSRSKERISLCRELNELDRDRDYIRHRIPQIIARLAVLRGADQDATYGKPAAPKSPIIEIIEDDATPAHHWHGYKYRANDWRAPV